MATNFRKHHASNSVENAKSIIERICSIKNCPFQVYESNVFPFDSDTRIGAEIVTHFNYGYHINIEVSEYLHPVNIIRSDSVDLNRIKARGNPSDSLLHFKEKLHLQFALPPILVYKLDLKEEVKYNIVKILSYSTPYDKSVERATYRLFLREADNASFNSPSGRPRKTVRKKLMWANIFDPVTHHYISDVSHTTSTDVEYHTPPSGFERFQKSPSPKKVRFEAQAGLFPSVSDFIGGETFSNLNTMAAQIQEFMPKAHESNDMFLSILQKVNDMISNENEFVVKEYIKTNIEKLQVNNDLRSISDDTLKGLSLAGFASASCYAYYSRSSGSYALLAASTIGVVYFYRDKLSDIVPLISKLSFINEEPVVDMMEAQINLDSNDFITLMATTLMGMSIRDSKAASLPQNVLKHIGDFSKYKDNLDRICTFIIELIGKILDSVNCSEYLPDNIRNYHVLDADIMEIVDAMSLIRRKQNERTFNICDDNYTIIVDLIRKCEMILINHKGKPRTHAHISISNHLTTLKKIADQFRDAQYQIDGLRMEPICMLLAGGPGTLKSSSLYHFVEAICPFILTEDEKAACVNQKDKYVYNRTVESQYWDSMTSEKRVCVFDDFGQIRDMVGAGDNEFMNLIRSVNEFEYNPHMAEIGNKGNIKFRCKAVLATSNSTNWAIESIIQPEAVSRRFDLSFICIPKPEFELNPGKECNMNKKFDFDRLPTGCKGVTSVAPDAVLFVEYDLIKKCETGRVFNFEEVVDVMKHAYDVKCLRFDQKRAELKERNAYYESKYCSDPIAFANIYDKKDSSILLEAQTGFDVDQFETIEPEYLSQNVARMRRLRDIPLIIDHNDKWGTIAVAYHKYAYEQLDSGNSTPLARMYDFFEKVNLGMGVRAYADVVMLYAFIKMYGTAFMKDLSSDKDLDEIYVNYPANLKKLSSHTPQINLRTEVTDSIISSYKSMKERFYECINTPIRIHLTNFRKFCDQNKTVIASTIGLIGLITSFYYKFSGNKDRDNQFGYNLRKGNLRTTKEIARKAAGTAHPESQYSWGDDVNGEQIINSVILNNVYEISHRSKKDDTVRKLGYVTFVIDTFGIVPKHFLLILSNKCDADESMYDDFIDISKWNGGKLHKKWVISVREFLCNAVSVTNMEANDLALVRFPRCVGLAKNILDNFANESTVKNLKDMKGKLYIPDQRWAQCQNVNVEKMKNQFVSLTDGVVYEILNGYEYDAHTQKGDCGALLAIMNSRVTNKKIFGIHTAGQTANSTGFASAITREMLDDALSYFKGDIIDEPLCKEAQSGVIIGDGRFTELYDIDKPMHSSGKSAIIKSILHSAWKESSLAPAKLAPFYREGELINPMTNALSKYCSPGIFFPTDVLEHIRDDISDFLEFVSKEKVDRKVISYEEAICGIEGEVLFGSISRKTSPGYPWIRSRPGGVGKFYLFGNDDTYDLDNKEATILRESVDRLLSLASEGKRSRIIFSDNLKDETRPIAKVLAGKTRLFSGCPIDYLIAFRMYFGSFSLWFMKNKIANHSAIGVNPYSDEWDRIARYLLRNGRSSDKCIGAGDYGAFDGSEKTHIHWLIYDIAQKWYNDGTKNARIRKVLWCDLIQSKHVNGKTVYQWDSSLPSGHPWTIIVNGLYNEVAFRYCWAKTVKFDRILMHDFDKHVYVIFMGDDNAFSVSPLWRDKFNEMTLAKDMSDLGLSYTTEHKEEAIVPLRKIGEIDFLKRAFILDNAVQRYIAPLQLDVVLEIPFWTRTHDTRTITEDNCETTIKELSLHGREVFEKHMPAIKDAMMTYLGHGPKFSSFDVAFDTILDSEFMY